MGRKELKQWSKEKIKGNIFRLFGVIFVTSFLTNLSFGSGNDEHRIYLYLGFLLSFIEVGLVDYFVKFITDKECNFGDIFGFAKDYAKIFITNLLRDIFITLWTLLLIVPGIIKLFAYQLVPMLLRDKKYKDLESMQILKKSEEMMMGHKMEYFLLNLSFIGWHILAIPTLFLLEIWIIPYQQVTTTKYLYDLKCSYDEKNS